MSDLSRLLSIESGLSELDILRILRTAHIRYKYFQIPKRDGSLRTVSQPAREVKLLQRIFVKKFLCELPVHQAATAYRDGKSIKHNAKIHAGRGPILKMDLKNFFPSIRREDWLRYCAVRGDIALSEEDIAQSANLLFHKTPGLSSLRLAIGAPSSPVLSNILMAEFDHTISAKVEKDHVNYSRYADDMTFSGARTGYLVNVQKIVRSTLRELISPRLTLNEEKTVYITAKYHRTVTGLTLANDGRVTIGRELKRLLHASVHRAGKVLIELPEMQKLAGMLAFVKSVEPDFIDILGEKYGPDLIRRIQKTVVIVPFNGPRRRRRI